MKRILAVIAQFLLFLIVDAIGSIFYHPFHIQTSLAADSAGPRAFAWDGLILALLLYLFFLIIAALRKRLAHSAPVSTIAFALAVLVGYLMKFGFYHP